MLNFLFYPSKLTKLRISLPITGYNKENDNDYELCLTGIGNQNVFFQIPLTAFDHMISKEITFSQLLDNNVIQKYNLSSLSTIYDYILCPRVINNECESSNLLICGRYPILTLFEPGGKNSHFNLRSIISSLANKITNTVTNVVFQFARGWGFGSSKTDNDNDNNEILDLSKLLASTTIPSHFTVSDPTRTIESMLCDPTLKYCVGRDNFGRVLLIDINKSTILYIWKGYRNASFGWFEYPEFWDGQWTGTPPPTDCSNGKWGLYLVIYAPFRKSLEIYRVIDGKRVYIETLSDDIYTLRTISPEGPLSNTLNEPTKCYLVNDCSDNNQLEIYNISLDINSLDYLYLKKHSPYIQQDVYHIKLILRYLNINNEKEEYIKIFLE